jgi:hypothetical protein
MNLTLNEKLRFQKQAGIINESQYKKLLKEEEEMTPEQATAKVMAAVPEIEKSPEMRKLIDKIRKDPNLIKQLQKSAIAAGITLNEDESSLDMQDMKDIALKFASKASDMYNKTQSVDEHKFQSYDELERLRRGQDDETRSFDTKVAIGVTTVVVGGVLAALFLPVVLAGGFVVGTTSALSWGIMAAIAGVALYIVAKDIKN